ncbi:hypothetical protein BMW23_0347 [Bodo saltans virus]|jgi:hypothetical protein|uniref:Uncharacterized protein n=1 Tax=Bodo saltans virus TaxID=2024608 RepID=A0A2H4UTZ8_9VIRU|nr:hypothetical protein QJ851_gp0339 [Bodo saltans virus]ATZ80402.1 hypothetical protein BMW23_0347 [Bodo saltans virus]
MSTTSKIGTIFLQKNCEKMQDLCEKSFTRSFIVLPEDVKICDIIERGEKTQDMHFDGTLRREDKVVVPPSVTPFFKNPSSLQAQIASFIKLFLENPQKGVDAFDEVGAANHIAHIHDYGSAPCCCYCDVSVCVLGALGIDAFIKHCMHKSILITVPAIARFKINNPSVNIGKNLPSVVLDKCTQLVHPSWEYEIDERSKNKMEMYEGWNLIDFLANYLVLDMNRILRCFGKHVQQKRPLVERRVTEKKEEEDIKETTMMSRQLFILEIAQAIGLVQPETPDE